jgi:hypothetical protein
MLKIIEYEGFFIKKSFINYNLQLGSHKMNYLLKGYKIKRVL